jgi:hypothetical protein
LLSLADQQHICSSYRVVVVNFWRVIDGNVEASQVDFIPPSEIGMKFAAFGLAPLEGDVKAIRYSIAATVFKLISMSTYPINIHMYAFGSSIKLTIYETKADEKENENIMALTPDINPKRQWFPPFLDIPVPLFWTALLGTE